MKENFAFIRTVDQLGRIVIPKDLRVLYGMDCGETVKISLNPKGVLIEPYKGKVKIKKSTPEK